MDLDVTNGSGEHLHTRKLNYDQEIGPGIIHTAAVWTLGPLSIPIAVLCAGTGFASRAWHGGPPAAGKADS
jgi:hypothetical protein